MRALADVAAAQGVDIFYSTAAKQLVGDASGVTGVIAQGDDGNVQFNAAKGVIQPRATTRTTTTWSTTTCPI